VAFDPALRRRFEPFREHRLSAMLEDAELRAAWDEAFCHSVGYERPTVRVSDHEAEGPIGPFRLRVFQPLDDGRDRPVLVWVHGGGFVSGGIDTVEGDVASREICVRADAVVVAVDYHLAAGRVRYPTLHREVIAAVEWTRSHAEELGADPARLTLGGGSAGGNLTVAAAMEMRDLGRELPTRLAIVYPALHRDHLVAADVEAELRTLPAMCRINQAGMDVMFDAYVGEAQDTTYAAPGDCDPAGLPPCLVVVGEYDMLRSSGERFVDAARAAGVDVELYLAEGMPHGHLNMTPLVPETDATLTVLADFVR
jgi:acetyl esterase